MATLLTSGYTALITGASAGLGAEFARQMAPEAGVLVLVARRVERLDVLKEELTLKYRHLKVYTFPVDLCDEAAIDSFLKELHEEKGLTIDYLVNNAGLGDIGDFDSAEWERVHAMLRVNMEAYTKLAHAFLPGMIARKRGIVLNVASTAGLLPLPTFAVYAATKAYLCSWSEALAIELRPKGVSVTVCCPGPVETEFGEVATRPDSKRKFAPTRMFYVPAEKVVSETLAAAKRGKPRVIPGLQVWLGASILEVIPMWVLRLCARIGDKVTTDPK